MKMKEIYTETNFAHLISACIVYARCYAKSHDLIHLQRATEYYERAKEAWGYFESGYKEAMK